MITRANMKLHKPTSSFCRKCGKCCNYFCVEVDAPESIGDVNDYAWILAHKNVSIHIEKSHWYLMVKSRCRYLKNGQCKIYEGRPRICRKHSPSDCEFDMKSQKEYDDVDTVVTDIHELMRFGKNLFSKKKKTKPRRKKTPANKTKKKNKKR